MSRIVSIGTAVPEFCTKQSDILNFMQTAYNDETASRKLNILFSHSGISSRYSVLPDFNIKQMESGFFNKSQFAPTVEKRMAVFKDNVLALAIEGIKHALQKINTPFEVSGITHIISVTCTGMYAPGLDAELVTALNLPKNTFHTAVNFLGCNAAFHALKIADLIAKTTPEARVLIVCAELCTLHFQPKDNNDNLLSNTIFGDGAASVIVEADAFATQQQHEGLDIKGFYSLLLDKGRNLIGWNITPLNFEMILDSTIPEYIGNEIGEIVTKALGTFNIPLDKVDKWAIHPGGKKILDTIQKQLSMEKNELQYSYKVLNDYGNMSSPSILFVLHEMMHTGLKSGETIFAIGFGPGLSVDTVLFTYDK